MDTKFTEDEDMTFTVYNADGEEVECEILFTFEDESTGKNYVVFTDNTLDEDGSTQVFANELSDDGDGADLLPIEDPQIWDTIAQMLEQLQNELLDEEDSED